MNIYHCLGRTHSPTYIVAESPDDAKQVMLAIRLVSTIEQIEQVHDVTSRLRNEDGISSLLRTGRKGRIEKMRRRTPMHKIVQMRATGRLPELYHQEWTMTRATR